MVLCHQAKYSRGEYRETAKKLTGIGYNCLVPDLRSGVEVNDVRNQTHFRALDKHLPTDYLDAEQDIVAVVNFAHEKYDRKIILLGSSYSASLALKIGKGNKKVAAIIAFSPGEHFGKKLNLKKEINGLKKPVFLTSSKKESQALALLSNTLKKRYLHTGWPGKSKGLGGGLSRSRARPEAKSARAVKTWEQLGNNKRRIPCYTVMLDAAKG